MTDTPPKGRALIVARMSAQGWTVRKISAEAQVSETTVTRTRRRHRDWITAARDTVADETAAALLDMNSEALDALREMLHSPLDTIRFGAARFVIESSLRWRDQVDIERRLQALEADR
jgi:hypothetical protein